MPKSLGLHIVHIFFEQTPFVTVSLCIPPFPSLTRTCGTSIFLPLSEVSPYFVVVCFCLALFRTMLASHCHVTVTLAPPPPRASPQRHTPPPLVLHLNVTPHPPLVLHLNVTRLPPRASPQRHTPPLVLHLNVTRPPSCFTSTSHATPLVLHLNVTRHPPPSCFTSTSHATPLVLHLNVTRHPPLVLHLNVIRHPPPSCFTSTSHAPPSCFTSTSHASAVFAIAFVRSTHLFSYKYAITLLVCDHIASMRSYC